MSEPNSEVNEGSLSEKSTDALKSETWRTAREEIKKNLEKKHLEQEYGADISEPKTPIGKAISAIKKQAFGNVTSGDVQNDDAVQGDIPENEKAAKESINERAKHKLEAELKNAKEKSFAEPIIDYLLKRCAEDGGLCEDICQQHKTWKKCFDYIYLKAKKQANGSSQCAVRNDIVFEWAEDYFHLDDKEIERKKGLEVAERKKKQDEAAKKAKQKSTISKKETVSAKPMKNQSSAVPVNKPEKKSIKPKDQLEGQFSIFDLM